MKPKFKIGDKVRVGHPGAGYDIVEILEIGLLANQYRLKALTRNGYLNCSTLSIEIDELYYVYPLDDWIMEYADNALQRLKKRYAK